MNILETTSLLLIIYLCFLCTKSDLSIGIIHNKILAIFTIFAIAIDLVYYGYFVRDLFFEFLLNLTVVIVISLYLFYSHSFAGGDCKLIIVLAMLFPARYYLVYGNSNVTLFFAIGFAIFAGYCYLLISSIWAIISKKVTITYNYLKGYVLSFLKSYIAAILYISLINIIFEICGRFGLNVNVWVARIFSLSVAWCVGRFPVFKKKVLLLPTLVAVVGLSLLVKRVPVSLNSGSYTLVLVLLFCQMTIKRSIYERVAVDQLKKGMILSTVSSILMQTSITKGLPGVSTEDLKSRLTLNEIESIKIWAKATHTESLIIVKKIPFAIFITIGFISYYVLGSVSV